MIVQLTKNKSIQYTLNQNNLHIPVMLSYTYLKYIEVLGSRKQDDLTQIYSGIDLVILN